MLTVIAASQQFRLETSHDQNVLCAIWLENMQVHEAHRRSDNAIPEAAMLVGRRNTSFMVYCNRWDMRLQNMRYQSGRN